MTAKSTSVNKTVKKVGKQKHSVVRKSDKHIIGASKDRSDQLLTQARDLAWKGQHPKAIEICTQALDAISKGNSRTAQSKMELLDLRAESYSAQLNLDAAEKDSILMIRIANAQTKPAFKAQALIRKGWVQGARGNYKLAPKTFSLALKFARQSKQKHLEAESLFGLGHHQIGERSIKPLQQAADLFLSLGNQSRTGHTLAALAAAFRNAGQIEEAQHTAQTALMICEKAGDNIGKGWALNVLGPTQTDLTLVLKFQKQAHQAFEAAGNLGAIAGIINNLGYTYLQLGLYPRALRSYQKSLNLDPADVIPLANIADVEIKLNTLDQAHKHIAELRLLFREKKNWAFTEELLGRMALIEDKPKVALKHFKMAIQISHEAGLVGEIGELTLLGQAYLAGRNFIAALKATSQAAQMHRDLNFPFVDDHPSQNIWWRHAQTLQANKKNKKADEALEMAYDFLLKGIANLHDHGLRRNYLNKVIINREIIQAWGQHATKHKLPWERRFAHLAVESSLREPFERLAEISLELNALHTIKEIQTFLVEEATELSGGERVLLILEKDGELEVADSPLPHGEDSEKVLASIGKHLTSARFTRTTQLILPKKTGLSRIIAPLIAQNQLIGYLYADMDSLYGRFDETDRDMLGMLANQGAIALDNADLLEGLEQKVHERTAELQTSNANLEQRNAELQIINSIQQGLAAELDFQSIVNLVGDKLSEVLNTGNLGIRWYDEKTDLIHFPYEFEHGQRLTLPPKQPRGEFRKMQETRAPIVGNTSELMAELNMGVLPGTEVSRSLAHVPVLINDRVIGVIVVEDYEHEDPFSESYVRLIQTIAASLASALENARLFDETQRLLKETEQRNAELQLINSIQQGLAAELNFQAIVDLVGDKLREVLNTPDIAIRWYDEQANLMHYLYVYERGERLTIAPQSPIPGGQFETLVKTRQPVVANYASDYARLNIPLVPGTNQSKSLVSVPIISSDRVLGLISTENYELENAFGESEIRLLTTIAASLGTALENARLFDETQRLLKETEQRNAELAIINSVQDALAAKLDLQGIYDAVGDKMREIFKADTTLICFHDVENNLIVAPYYRDREMSGLIRRPYGRGLAEIVIETGKPLLLNTRQEAEEAGFFEIASPGSDKDLNESTLFVPIFRDGKAIGATSVQNYKQSAYDQSDLRLLTTLTNSMSVALENARLFDETQRLLKETEERNAELAIINSVQEGLVAKMDIQGIYDLVGDKIREIFDAQVVLISIFDDTSEVSYLPYIVEKGQRLAIETGPLTGLERYMSRTRQIFLSNEHSAERAQALWGEFNVPAGEAPKSLLVVPLIVADQVKGIISLQNVDRENAFNDSDVRLLTTLVNSMSVALENARLFDETQRLLKETEQRNAELAIINSVQEGLASRLEMQAIYDLVGDKIREVFDAQVVTIQIFDYDKQKSILHYGIEKGERFYDEPSPLTAGHHHFVELHQPLLIRDDWLKEMREFGYIPHIVAGTQAPKSSVFVPLIVNNEVKGSVTLQNVDRENAFSESDVRLLQTLANSLSVSLENARLFDEVQKRNREITEALEQQTASGEILRVIASSPTDIQPVLDTVAKNAAYLCDSEDCAIFRVENGVMILKAYYGSDLTTILGSPYPLNRETIAGRAILEKKIVHIPDLARVDMEFPLSKEIQRTHRAFLAVPLLREDQIIGVIFIRRLEAQPFSDSQIQLVKTFADQAIIAIENVRLFTETQRLLKETEQRAAELAIINSVQDGLASKLDIQAIYDLVGDKMREIFNAETIYIAVRKPPDVNFAHFVYFVSLGTRIYDEPPTIPAGFGGRVIATQKPLLLNHIDANVMNEYGSYLQGLENEEKLSRSWMGSPIISSGQVMGVISIQNLREDAFTESDLRLLITLTNSMSVALENARLFDETQRLLKETEQRAAELAIINSVQTGLASNLEMQAIYDLVGDKIREIFDAQGAGIAIVDREREMVLLKYLFEDEQIYRDKTFPLGQGLTSLVLETRKTILIQSDEEGQEYRDRFIYPGSQVISKSWLTVPILIGGEAIGALNVQNFEREHAYSDSDVRLLQTLASSLGVALENARLFAEERQRATELEAISTVSQALVAETDLENMIQLIGGQMRDIFQADIVYVALLDPQTRLIHFPYQIGESFDTLALGEGLTSQIIQSGRPLLINKNVEERRKELGTKLVGREALSYLGVPIKSGRNAIGVLSIQSTKEENVFSDNDTRLLSTLAINIGIAIERARLFNEIQTSNREITEALEQQTATSEILSIIVENPTYVQPVLDAVAERAARLCNSYDAAIVRIDGNIYRIVAHWGSVPLPEDNLLNGIPLNRDTVTGRAMVDKKTIHIHDLLAESIDEYPLSRQYYRTSEQRTMLVTPLMRENEVIGSIMIRRQEVNPFTEKQITLLKIFADQAAIAIENVRLFNEIQTRNREITESLQQQTAISEILRVTASSPTDIQPVMNVIAENARLLLNGYLSGVYLVEAGMIDEVAMSNFTSEGLELHEKAYPRPLAYDSSASSRAVLERKVQNLPTYSMMPRSPN
jgi:GAF domain-containing protein/tetratricopeptide (TPR) repeat protein